MSKLEMVYLMKVSLHLPTFEDKFMKHFEVETIKCGLTGYFISHMYENVKCIRYPIWDYLNKEDEEIAKKIIIKSNCIEFKLLI
ncbi:hypothetical protein QTN25_007201 [Entamoeba marina]